MWNEPKTIQTNILFDGRYQQTIVMYFNLGERKQVCTSKAE